MQKSNLIKVISLTLFLTSILSLLHGTALGEDVPDRRKCHVCHGTVNFSAATYSVNESELMTVITIMRTNGDPAFGATRTLRVTLSTADGTATAGTDYVAVNKTINLPFSPDPPGLRGTTSVSETITIINDPSGAGSKTVNLNLSDPMVLNLAETVGLPTDKPENPFSNMLAFPSNAVLTIEEEEVEPVGSLQFSASSYNVNEEGGSAAITITRTGGSKGAVSVTFQTVGGGSATAGADYKPVTQMVNFADGDTASKTVNVPIAEDLDVEDPETVNLSLSNPTGGAILGSLSSALLKIVSNDVPPAGSLQFSADTYNVNEGGGSAAITITRTGGSNGAVSVTFQTDAGGIATAGLDYAAITQTVSFADGDTASKTVNIPIAEDLNLEGPETVNLSLTSAIGGAILGSSNIAVLTIADNDDGALGGTLQFSQSGYTASENRRFALITVTRAGGTPGTVAVDYATSNGTAVEGTDYTATSGTLTFAGRQNKKTFKVAVTNDSIVNNDRTVNLSLSNPTGGAVLGAQHAAVLTINNDDAGGEINFRTATYRVSERRPFVKITVKRTGGKAGGITVDYATSNGTATAGTHYTATSGTLTFEGSRPTATFDVAILNNLLDEPNPTFQVTLSNPQGGGTLGGVIAAEVTILDDDRSQPVAGRSLEDPNPENTAAPAGEAEFALNRRRMDFGRVFLNNMLSRPIEVLNMGGGDLEVREIKYCPGTSTEFAWSPNSFRVSPGSAQTVTLFYRPVHTESDEGCLLFYTNDATQNPAQLMVGGMGVNRTPGSLVDVDIDGFNVTSLAGALAPGGVAIQVKLTDAGAGGGTINVTVVGEQNGEEIYRHSLPVTLRHQQNRAVGFPAYTPVRPGEIVWIARVDDDDPDVDEATAITTVAQ